MQADTVSQVRAHPAFHSLESKRGGFSRALCLVILVIYYGFIVVVAFRPDITAIPVGYGITLAFPLGLAVILSAIIVTGVYVLRANGEFDRLTRTIKRDVR